MSKFRFVFIFVMLAGVVSCSATSYPGALHLSKPNPEPALPAAFDPFDPPVSNSLAAAGAPVVAEWTKTAPPDSVVALTGSRFSTLSGSDTQFQVFGQSASATFTGAATILKLDGMKAAIVLPATLPSDSEYLVWPINSVGAGNPVAINATEAWWIGPNAATRGDTVSLYGRNLSHNGSPATSYIYIQKDGAAGTWANVTAANPYKVDFTVPAGLADGTYQVWVHNGHGGHYGWSGPLALTVNDGTPWTLQQFNVRNYGAKGDGVTDDEAAINAAVTAAGRNAWSTLYFPAGTYLVSRGFHCPSKVRWLGDGATKTFLKASVGFVKPASYDDRRYCLLFGDGGASSITIQDMTIDANGNMNGYLNEPVYMRFDLDLRFINVTINAKGYGIGDFHSSTRVSFENCSLTGGGSGIFFGSATQVFLDRCQIFGTNDANTLLTWWGGDGMSCTNTTAQDYDNTKADGWAQGRFIYGTSQWGSNRDIYIGNDTTRALAVRPGFADQNSGEQLLWEDGTKYSAKPLSASATTVVFGDNAIFRDANLLAGCYDAVITNGTGLGQHRKIVGCSGATITVSPAWNVPPDSNSTVIIAGVVSHCAIYENTLQGKSDYATRETASVGVQPYGNSFDFVVDGNTISQVRDGIHIWGMNEASLSPQSITCAYFNYIANNSVHDCSDGIYGVSVAWNGWPASDPYPGISYLANTFVDNTVDSIQASGLAAVATSAPIGDQVDLSVFDHNLVSNTPTVLDLPADSRLQNTIIYSGQLQVEATPAASPPSVLASAVASVATTASSVALSRAAVSTTAASPTLVAKATTSSAPASSPSPTPAATKSTVASVSNSQVKTTLSSEAPAQLIAMKGVAKGFPVTKTFAIARKASAVAWSIKTGTDWSSTEWLKASLSAGAVSGAESDEILNVTCNPKTLLPGVYSGTALVQNATSTRRYTVVFVVK